METLALLATSLIVTLTANSLNKKGIYYSMSHSGFCSATLQCGTFGPVAQPRDYR
ncbi:hypothetical protein YKD1_05150 [Yersinia pseudotuberculosis]|nr:hypothetical protein YP1_019_00460 [Yersinia pseudotuberculosis NBRC 105692]